MDIRNLINLVEATTSDPLSSLKRNVIDQVKRTTDQELLDKIYTVLNKSGLETRISSIMGKEYDAKGYLRDLTQIIIDTPGTYHEKMAFADGFPDGYVDVKRMLSGERVHFEDLLVPGKNKNAPMAFVHKVFNALRQVSLGTEKGPGEFALAILSPKISIFDKGDLKIGNMKIEVKASSGGKTGTDISSGGGRIGTSGWLNHQRVPAIVQKYFNIDPTKTLGLNEFSRMLSTQPVPMRAKIARELFGYIFEGKHADITPLVNAAKEGADLNKAYIKVSYSIYQASSKFDGIMLMNFPLQELKYFTDPEKMADEIYAPSVALISSNEGFSGRNILPTVTLAPEKVEKVDLPSKEEKDIKVIKTSMRAMADNLVKAARIREPGLSDKIYDWLVDQWTSGVAPTTIKTRLIHEFPQLRKRPETPAPMTAADTKALAKAQNELKQKIHDYAFVFAHTRGISDMNLVNKMADAYEKAYELDPNAKAEEVWLRKFPQLNIKEPATPNLAQPKKAVNRARRS